MSLFSGVLGLELGLSQLGPQCSRLTHMSFLSLPGTWPPRTLSRPTASAKVDGLVPTAERHWDARTFNGKPGRSAGCVAGFPCQAGHASSVGSTPLLCCQGLSRAGLGQGLADCRSSLRQRFGRCSLRPICTFAAQRT